MVRKVYQYVIAMAVKDSEPHTEATIKRILHSAVNRHCESNRLQRIGDAAIEWRGEPSDTAYPWRVYATFSAIKLGRRKMPYPLPEEGLSTDTIRLQAIA